MVPTYIGFWVKRNGPAERAIADDRDTRAIRPRIGAGTFHGGFGQAHHQAAEQQDYQAQNAHRQG
jgi:hypothetical protein